MGGRALAGWLGWLGWSNSTCIGWLASRKLTGSTSLLFCLPAGKDGQPIASKYDLAANIVHEGKAGAGQGLYRVHIQRKASSVALFVGGGAAQAQLPGCLPGCVHLLAATSTSPKSRSKPSLRFHPAQVEDVWYEVQDLRVTEVLPQMVALSETYIQVYELKQG